MKEQVPQPVDMNQLSPEELFNPAARNNPQAPVENFDYMADFGPGAVTNETIPQAAADEQSKREMAIYLDNRPEGYLTTGVMRGEGGKFKNAAKHFDEQREIAAEANNVPYEEQPTFSLFTKLTESEKLGDKTTVANISEVIESKIAEDDMKFSEVAAVLAQGEFFGAEATTALANKLLNAKMVNAHNTRLGKIRGPKDSANLAANREATDKLRARVMKLKDQELARLKALETPQDEHESEKQAVGQKIQYRPRKDGKIQLGIEFDQEGDLVNLDEQEHAKDVESRRVLLTDKNGNEYYIKGRTVYNLGGPFDENAETYQREVPEDHEFSLKIGRNDLDSIEIAAGLVDSAEDAAGFEPNGEDPFERIEARLAKEASGENNDDDTEGRNDYKARGARVRAAMRNPLLWAGIQAQNAWSRATEYFGDEEKGRRRKGAALIAGMLAVGGASYLATKGLMNPEDHRTGTGSGVGSLPVSGNGAHAAAQHGHDAAQHGAHGAAGHGSHGHEHAKSVRLHSGENPWDVSEHQLQAQGNAHPTNAQIADYDRRLLHVNHITPEQAHHLAINAELELPDED